MVGCSLWGGRPECLPWKSTPLSGDLYSSRVTAAAKQRRFFGLSRETVLKMCRFSLRPGYTRKEPATKPKLGLLLPVKQRHPAKRIFERRRDVHGFGGGYTVVKHYVCICRARGRETVVPLAHPPGHGQVDFSEAVAIIGGVRQKIHFFCMELPQSDARFVKAYPRVSTEAYLDGQVSAFAFFGGVALSLLYDNLKIAVAKICGDGKREPTRAFTELLRHYLFADRFGRPGKGNDKGKVEGLVKFSRANFMVPIPVAASYEELNAMLAARCRARATVPGNMPRLSVSASWPTLRRCGGCRRHRWSRARSAPGGCRRRRWSATAPTITRCRPALASRTSS